VVGIEVSKQTAQRRSSTPVAGLGGGGCFCADLAGVGLLVLGRLLATVGPTGGLSSVTVDFVIAGPLSVAVGFPGGGCDLDSFILTITLSLCSWFDLQRSFPWLPHGEGFRQRKSF